MTVKIVGIENQNFTFDDGKTYCGKKLHCVVVDEHKDGLLGCPVSVVKVSDKSEFYNLPLELDKLYLCFFDQKGKLAYLAAQK